MCNKKLFENTEFQAFHEGLLTLSQLRCCNVDTRNCRENCHNQIAHIKETSKCSIPLTLSNARTICLQGTSLTPTFLKQVSYSAPCLIDFLSRPSMEIVFAYTVEYSSRSSNNCTRQMHMETPLKLQHLATLQYSFTERCKDLGNTSNSSKTHQQATCYLKLQESRPRLRSPYKFPGEQ